MTLIKRLRDALREAAMSSQSTPDERRWLGNLTYHLTDATALRIAQPVLAGHLSAADPEAEEWLEEVIGDSFEMDWQARDGARAIVRALSERTNEAPAMFLIWSNEHRAWWRPGSAGYTIHAEAAGRYSHRDALRICSGARDGWRPGSPPPEVPVAEADVLACEAHYHRMRPPVPDRSKDRPRGADEPGVMGAQAAPATTHQEQGR